jgi:hypothetical protein
MLKALLGDKLRIAGTYDLLLPKNEEFAITTMAGKVGKLRGFTLF